MQAALGELGHVDPRGALRESDRRRCCRVFLARVVPEVELAAHEEKEPVLEPHDEWPAVELEERESRSESADHRDERACQEIRNYPLVSSFLIITCNTLLTSESSEHICSYCAVNPVCYYSLQNSQRFRL